MFLLYFEGPQIPRTDVASLNRSLWCAETQSNVLVPSSASFSDGGGLRLGLGVQEDMGLLLVSALALDGQFGGHGCGGCRVASRVVGFFVVGQKV